MALRKASAYSRKTVRPYTRKSARKAKAYIKAVPPLKIAKYNMGNAQLENSGKHNYIVRLISEEKAQMRDNSLEACRMLIVKNMDLAAPGMYYFIIRVFPHHILRENKTAAGAGADRLSSGMKHSFGIAIGRAAIVPPQKSVFEIYCPDEKTAQAAKATLGKVKSKVPFRNRVVFEKVSG